MAAGDEWVVDAPHVAPLPAGQTPSDDWQVQPMRPAAQQLTPQQAEQLRRGYEGRHLMDQVPIVGQIAAPIASALADPETSQVIGRNVRGAMDTAERELPRVNVQRFASDTGAAIGRQAQGFARDPLGSIGRFLDNVPGAVWQSTLAPFLDAEGNAQSEDLARVRGDEAGVREAAERRAGNTGRMITNVAGAVLAPLAGARPFTQGALAAALTAPYAIANGQGSLQERLPQAAVETGEAGLGGATLAGVAPPVLRGAERGLSPIVRPVASAASEAGQRIWQNFIREEGELTPAQVAQGRRTGAQAVANLARRADPAGARLTANEMEQRGAPVTAAEALGREAETQLKVAGRRSGATPDALESLLSERAVETPARIVEDFSQITGLNPEEIEGNFAAQNERLRQQARPQYERAYGFNGPVTSNELTSLLRTPAVRAAMRNAVEIAGNERIAPQDLGMSVGPSGDVEIRTPTMRTWDMVKRGLDQELEQFRDGTTNRLNLSSPRAQGILKVLNSLRDALTDERQPWGPSYRAALDAGGEPIRLEQAFNDAGRLMGNTVRMTDFDTRWNAMSPAQREAFRSGIVNDIRVRAMSGRTRLNDLLTRSYEQKIIRVFGEDQGRQIIQRIQDERFLLTHGRRMQPGVGSDTSETLLANEEQQRHLETAGHVVGALAEGKIGRALAHFFGDPLMGIIRGAQLPLDRASRDMMGELLMMPPSELAQTLKNMAAARQITMTNAQAMQAAGRIRSALTAAVAAQGARQSQAPYPSRALNQALSTTP